MEQAVLDVLSEYEARAKQEWRVISSLTTDEVTQRIDEFLIFIGPATGQLLHILAQSLQAKCLVEIGASYGYSTIWLADAARATGGKVHSFELSRDKVAYAQQRLCRLGLQDYVEFHIGDALQRLPELQETLDLVLIDCWKSLYVPCFELIHPKLASEGVVVADNMLYPVETRSEALRYQALVHGRADMDTVLLPVGSGIELSRKRGAGRPR